MSVKIEIRPDRISAKVSTAFMSDMELLSTEILADCNEYCKRDIGTLILSSFIHSRLDKGKLIWDTPYAARQYYEIPTASTDRNPKATWKWCEAAKLEFLSAWRTLAEKLMRRNL